MCSNILFSGLSQVKCGLLDAEHGKPFENHPRELYPCSSALRDVSRQTPGVEVSPLEGLDLAVGARCPGTKTVARDKHEMSTALQRVLNILYSSG